MTAGQHDPDDPKLERDTAVGTGVVRPDQRRFARHRFRRMVSVSWILNDKPERARPIEAQDIGQGGIGFVSRAPVPVGTVGVVMMPRQGQPPVLHVCCVANCRYEGEMRHRIGAKWTDGDPDTLGVRIGRGPSGPRLDVFR